ncbi:hypothetical protein [Sporosarcina sp. P33]|nr:hypothetical protein [Sporosarcina sp. P33]
MPARNRDGTYAAMDDAEDEAKLNDLSVLGKQSEIAKTQMWID